MENFWFTDDWSAGKFQEFTCWCWTNKFAPTPALAKQWEKRRNARCD